MDYLELLSLLRAQVGDGRAHVLVVDDDAAIRAMLIEILETETCTVAGAVDGMDGLAQARSRRPDCILLDLMMPVMSGHEFLAALRSDPSLAAIPVVVMSAGRVVVDRGPTPPDPAAFALRGVRPPAGEQDSDDLPVAKAVRR